jgi:hypothetical protein
MTTKCLKCNITFRNEELAAEHVVKTGSYSPLHHVTRLHKVIEVEEK